MQYVQRQPQLAAPDHTQVKQALQAKDYNSIIKDVDLKQR